MGIMAFRYDTTDRVDKRTMKVLTKKGIKLIFLLSSFFTFALL